MEGPQRSMSIKGCVCNVLPGHRKVPRGKGCTGLFPKRGWRCVALRLCGCLGWKHWSRYLGASNRGPRRTPGIDFSGQLLEPLGSERVEWTRLRIHIHIHLDLFFFTLRPRNNWRIQNETTVSLPAFFWPGWLVWYLIEQGPNRKWPKYQALHLYTPKTCFKRHIIWLAAISLMQHKFINTIQTESDWLKAFRPPENRKLEF